MTRPDTENVQPVYRDSQRPSAQLLPADAVASSEARLTTRDIRHERTAGPNSPDSYSLPGLLEGATATLPRCFADAAVIRNYRDSHTYSAIFFYINRRHIEPM